LTEFSANLDIISDAPIGSGSQGTVDLLLLSSTHSRSHSRMTRDFIAIDNLAVASATPLPAALPMFIDGAESRNERLDDGAR